MGIWTMLFRRSLCTRCFQIGLFFLICYVTSLLLPYITDQTTEDSSAITHEVNREQKLETSIATDTNRRKYKFVSAHTQQSSTNADIRTIITRGVVDSVHGVVRPHNVKEIVQLQVNNSQNRDHQYHSDSVLSQPFKHKCKEPLCAEYLTKEDRSRFNSCLQKVKSHKGQPKDGQCHFMPQDHRAPVALASYPGSGNTWVRGLLETATGICTGFEFCDISMRVKGFAGENIVSGAVSVVKTHGYPHWKNKRKNNVIHFDSAVVLIRNPLDAFVAEWNRKIANNFRGSTVSLTSHVKSAGKEMFGNNPKWVEFLREQVPRWQALVKDWVSSHGRHNILVVKYEDLKRNTVHQVKRILTFLKIPYTDQDLEGRLARGFDSFHRSHKPNFEHYTPLQRQRVLRAINDTIELLNRSKQSHLLDLHEYVQQKDVN